MRSLSRRALLGASATAGVSALSGCGIFNAPDARGAISSANPFGVPKLSTIEAFATSRFGVEPWNHASTAMLTKFSDATFTFGVADDPTATLRPRFLDVPPDLVVNAGPDAMPMSPLLSKITDLTPFLSVVNYDGTAMRDVLVDGTIAAGTANGVIATLNYVRVVYGLWYSDSLFGAYGWAPPTSWSELQTLGADTAKRGISLLGTSADSVLDLQTLVIDSAIKQGGDEVRLAFENLSTTAWFQPSVKAALTGLKRLIDAGHLTRYPSTTALRQAWGNQRVAMLPSGSWLDWQTAYQRVLDFNLALTPAPVVDASAVMGADGLHAAPEEPVIIPRSARDPWGGQELLRAMLSRDAATYLATQFCVLPSVRDIVPVDGFGSSGLASQVKAIANAGDSTFGWRFVEWYGLAASQATAWNNFLAGGVSIDTLAGQLQAASNAVLNDSTISKVQVR